MSKSFYKGDVNKPTYLIIFGNSWTLIQGEEPRGQSPGSGVWGLGFKAQLGPCELGQATLTSIS